MEKDKIVLLVIIGILLITTTIISIVYLHTDKELKLYQNGYETCKTAYGKLMNDYTDCVIQHADSTRRSVGY